VDIQRHASNPSGLGDFRLIYEGYFANGRYRLVLTLLTITQVSRYV
jgi:hypothetical protein